MSESAQQPLDRFVVMLESPFLKVEGEVIFLKASQFRMMEILMSIRNEAVSKEKLSIKLFDDANKSREVLRLILILKEKFAVHEVPALIRTIPSWGFMLVTDKKKFDILDQLFTVNGLWRDRKRKYSGLVLKKGKADEN